MARSSRKIQATTNYKLFKRSTENRPLDVKKHKALIRSMQKYGFLPCFPIVACRDSKGDLWMKDGQHRLAIAESLGIAVFWVEESVDFDVADTNNAQKIWNLEDYARKYADNGVESYREGLEFREKHGIPIGQAFALLGGTCSFSNIEQQYFGGQFNVKDRKWADAVAGIYVPLVAMNRKLRNARFIEACMAVCRVKTFEADRLISGAEKCREKLIPYATRDAYLDMLEELYNFKRHYLLALKTEATMAMRARNAAQKKKTLDKNFASGAS